MTESALGRKGVVQNLVSHLLRGTSAVVTSGPKMGKTTLLQQAAAGLARKAKTVSLDLSKDRPADPSGWFPRGTDSVILLLDGCEALLPDPMPFLNAAFRMLGSSEKNKGAVVWAGDMSWGAWATARGSDFGLPIRYYPLILLPPKEARPLLMNCMPKKVAPAEMERLLEKAGGHPYLLSHVLEADAGWYDSFFTELWQTAGSPSERFLLTALVNAGAWVRYEDLKDAAGARPSKKVLDRLATLGLIDRTLVEGAASVRIVSPLLGEWVRRTQHPAEGSD